MATALGKHPFHFVHCVTASRIICVFQKKTNLLVLVKNTKLLEKERPLTCMKTSGEDKFTDLEELNILIVGETGFPHLDIFTNQG